MCASCESRKLPKFSKFRKVSDPPTEISSISRNLRQVRSKTLEPVCIFGIWVKAEILEDSDRPTETLEIPKFREIA